MISSTAAYALRATVFLATCDGGYIGRSEIADATCVPYDYLLKVLNQLDAAGIIESRRGRKGGYRLISAPTEITALSVVLAVDNIPRITECPLGIKEHTQLCPLHQLLDDASRKVEEAFEQAKISDLIPQKQPRKCDFPSQKTPD